MITGELKKPDGTVLAVIEIPMSLSEIPLTKFIDFIIESRGMDNDAGNSIFIMSKAVNSVIGVDLQTVLMSAAGVGDLTNNNSMSTTVSKLYAHILKLISDFKPELYPDDFSFEYEGHTYYIPTIIKQAIAGEFTLPDLSVSEVIEVAEVARFRKHVVSQRGDPNGKLMKKINDLVAVELQKIGGVDPGGALARSAEKVYQSEVDAAGDPDGSMMLTYYLKTLAVLCRRKGETLPVEDSVREVWIQNRANHLIGLDAATALRVDFFLTNISPFYEERPAAVGFLKNQSFAVVAATRLKNAKRSTAQSITRKKYLKKSVGVK